MQSLYSYFIVFLGASCRTIVVWTSVPEHQPHLASARVSGRKGAGWKLIRVTTHCAEAVQIVALLNLGYFGVEFAVALAINSVSLFGDSIDLLEDAAVSLV